MRVWGMSAALVLGFAATAAAGPLDLKQVPAEAKWVVHVDVDAMRSSVLVQRAYDRLSEKRPDVERRLDEVTDLVSNLGIDLERELHGMTVYGKQIGQHEGVLLVDATVDRKALLEKADQAPDHQMTKYGDYELHSWTDAKGRQHEHPMAGTLSKSNLLVFAPTVDQIKPALDVLDGKSASLSGKESSLTAGTPAGAMIVIRAVGLADAKLPLKSPLVAQCEAVSLMIGEQDGKVSAEGKLFTKSKETAEQIKAIVEGGRAAAELRAGNDAEAAKVIKTVKVNLADTTLSVEFSSPVDDVWTLAEKAAKEIGKRAEKKTEAEKPGDQK